MASGGGLHDSSSEVINILAAQMQQGSTDGSGPFQRLASAPLHAAGKPEVTETAALLRRGRSAQLESQSGNTSSLSSGTNAASAAQEVTLGPVSADVRAHSRSRSPASAERAAKSGGSTSGKSGKQSVPVWERLFRTGTKSSMASAKSGEASGGKNTGRQLSSSVESLTPARSIGRRSRKQPDVRASHPPVGGLTSQPSATSDMMLMSVDSATMSASLPHADSGFSILDSAPAGRTPADVLTTTASDIAAAAASRHLDASTATATTSDTPSPSAPATTTPSDQVPVIPRVPSSVLAHVSSHSPAEDSPQFVSLDKIQSPLLFSIPDDPLTAAETSEASMLDAPGLGALNTTSRSSITTGLEQDGNNNPALLSTASTGVAIVAAEGVKQQAGSGQEEIASTRTPDPVKVSDSSSAAAATSFVEDSVFDPRSSSPSMLDGFESQREDLKFLIGKVKVQGLQELGEELLTMLSERDAASFGKMLALSTGTITKRLAVSSMLDCLPDQHLDTAASAVIAQLPRKHRRHVLQYIMTPKVQRTKSLPELLGENDPLEDIRMSVTTDDSNVMMVQRAHSLGESGAVSGLTRSVKWVGPGGEREDVSVIEGLMPSLSAEVSSASGKGSGVSNSSEGGAGGREVFRVESSSPLYSAPASLSALPASSQPGSIMHEASYWDEASTLSAPITPTLGSLSDSRDLASETAVLPSPVLTREVRPAQPQGVVHAQEAAAVEAAVVGTESRCIEADEDVDHKLDDSDYPMLGVVQHEEEEEEEDADDDDQYATIMEVDEPVASQRSVEEDNDSTTTGSIRNAAPAQLVRNESIFSNTTELSAAELDATTTLLPINSPGSPAAGTSARPHSTGRSRLEAFTSGVDSIPMDNTVTVSGDDEVVDTDAAVQRAIPSPYASTGGAQMLNDDMQVEEEVKGPCSPVADREPAQPSLYARLFGRHGKANAAHESSSSDGGMPSTLGSPPHGAVLNSAALQPTTPPSPLPPIVTSPSSTSESGGYNPLLDVAGPSHISPVDLDTPTSSGSLTSPSSSGVPDAESPTSTASDIMLVDTETGLPLVRQRSSDSIGSHGDRGEMSRGFGVAPPPVSWSDNALFRSGEMLQSTSSLRFMNSTRESIHVPQGMEQFKVFNSNPLADGQDTASSREENKFSGLLQELLDEPLSPSYLDDTATRVPSGASMGATETGSMTMKESVDLPPAASQELGRGESFATANSMDARQSSFASASSKVDNTTVLRSVDTDGSLAALGFCRSDSDLTGSGGVAAVMEAGRQFSEPVTKVGRLEGGHMPPPDDVDSVQEETEEGDTITILPSEVKPKGMDEFDDPITWDSPTGYTPSVASLSSYVGTGATSTPLTSPELMAVADLPEEPVSTTSAQPSAANPFTAPDPILACTPGTEAKPAVGAAAPQGLVTIGADIPAVPSVHGLAASPENETISLNLGTHSAADRDSPVSTPSLGVNPFAQDALFGGPGFTSPAREMPIASVPVSGTVADSAVSLNVSPASTPPRAESPTSYYDAVSVGSTPSSPSLRSTSFPGSPLITVDIAAAPAAVATAAIPVDVAMSDAVEDPDDISRSLSDIDKVVAGEMAEKAISPLLPSEPTAVDAPSVSVSDVSSRDNMETSSKASDEKAGIMGRAAGLLGMLWGRPKSVTSSDTKEAPPSPAAGSDAAAASDVSAAPPSSRADSVPSSGDVIATVLPEHKAYDPANEGFFSEFMTQTKGGSSVSDYDAGNETEGAITTGDITSQEVGQEEDVAADGFGEDLKSEQAVDGRFTPSSSVLGTKADSSISDSPRTQEMEPINPKTRDGAVSDDAGSLKDGDSPVASDGAVSDTVSERGFNNPAYNPGQAYSLSTPRKEDETSDVAGAAEAEASTSPVMGLQTDVSSPGRKSPGSLPPSGRPSIPPGVIQASTSSLLFDVHEHSSESDSASSSPPASPLATLPTEADAPHVPVTPGTVAAADDTPSLSFAPGPSPSSAEPETPTGNFWRRSGLRASPRRSNSGSSLDGASPRVVMDPAVDTTILDTAAKPRELSSDENTPVTMASPITPAPAAGSLEPVTPVGRKVLKAEEVERLRAHMKLLIDLASDSQLCTMYEAIQSSIGKTGFAWSDSPTTVAEASPLDQTPSTAGRPASLDSTPSSPPHWVSPSPDLSSPTSRIPLAPKQRPSTLPPSPKPSPRPQSPSSIPHQTDFIPSPEPSSSRDFFHDATPIEQQAGPSSLPSTVTAAVAAGTAAAGAATAAAITAIPSAIPDPPASVTPATPSSTWAEPMDSRELPATSTQLPADGSQSARELALMAHRAALNARAQELTARVTSGASGVASDDEEAAPLLPSSSIKITPAVSDAPEALALTPASSPARSTSPSHQPFAPSSAEPVSQVTAPVADASWELQFSLPTSADTVTPAATLQPPSRVATVTGDKSKPSGPASPLQSSTLEVVESMLFAGSDTTSPTQSTPAHSMTPDSAQHSLTPDSVMTPASSTMPDSPEEVISDGDTAPVAESPGTATTVEKIIVVGDISDGSNRSSERNTSAVEDEKDSLFSATESLSDGKDKAEKTAPSPVEMADNPLFGAEESSDGAASKSAAVAATAMAPAIDLKSRRLGSSESFYSAHDDSAPTTDAETEPAARSRELPPMPEEVVASTPPPVPTEWAAPLVDTPILHEAAERLLVDAPKQMKLDGANIALSQLSSATISSIIGIAMDRLTNEASAQVARESLSLITSFDAAWTILEFLPPGDRNNMARAWGAERTSQQKDVVTRKMLDRVVLQNMIPVAKKLAAKVPMDQVLAFSNQVLTQLDPSQLSQAVQGMLEAFPRRELCGWCQEARLKIPKNKKDEFDEWLVERVAAEGGLEGWLDAGSERAKSYAASPDRDTSVTPTRSVSSASPGDQSIMSEAPPSPSSHPSAIPSPPPSSLEPTPARSRPASSDSASSYRTAPADSATSRLPAVVDSASSYDVNALSRDQESRNSSIPSQSSSKVKSVPSPTASTVSSSRKGPKSTSQRMGLKAQLTQAAMMMGPDTASERALSPEEEIPLTTPFRDQMAMDSPRPISPDLHHLESLEVISETISAAPTPPDSPLRVPRTPGMSSADAADPENRPVSKGFAERTQSGGSLASSKGSGSMSFGRTTSEDGKKKKASGGLFACVAPAADGDMEGVTFMPDMPALSPLRSHSSHMEDDQATTPSFRTAPLAKSLTVQIPSGTVQSSTSPKLSPTRSAPAPISPTASSSRPSPKSAKSTPLTVQPSSNSNSSSFPGPQQSASSPKPAPSKSKQPVKLGPSLSMPTSTRHMRSADPEMMSTGDYSPTSLPGTNANFFATSISGASFASMPPVYMSADVETAGEREGQNKKKKWWRKIIPDYREYAKGGPIDRELKKQTGAAGRRYILVGNGLVVVDDMETTNSRESLNSVRSSGEPTPSRENSTSGRSRGWRRTPRAGSSSAQRSSHSASATRSSSVI